MKAILNWQNGLEFSGSADSGHQVIIDGPPDLGGTNAGFRPMEMLLLSVGSCSAMDVMHILKKSRQEVTDCRIEIDGQRAETEPKVFTDIHVQFVVTGRHLNEKHVARAVELSAEKYCSASIMLAASVNMSHGYTIVEAD
ncbi:MAG: OsmC family protein [Salinisphaera sp.]|nr:OsmC family protein [Salinisphaera sp.]